MRDSVSFKPFWRGGMLEVRPGGSCAALTEARSGHHATHHGDIPSLVAHLLHVLESSHYGKYGILPLRKSASDRSKAERLSICIDFDCASHLEA